jgi:hypothetical protein
MSSVLMKTEPKKRILAARWYVIIGTLWFGLGVAAITNIMSGAAGFGLYLAIAAAGAVLFGGSGKSVNSFWTQVLRMTEALPRKQKRFEV